MTSPLAALRDPQGRQGAADHAVTQAIVALDKGDNRSANAHISKAIFLLAKDRGEIGALALVAQELTNKGRPNEAARLLSEATQNAEVAQNPLVWAALAHAREQAGDKEAAKQALAEADNRAKAIITQASIVNGNREKQMVLGLRGVAGYYVQQKRGQEAIAALREAYRLDNTDPIVCNGLGYNLAEFGTTPAEYAEAVNLTRRAVQAVPSDGTFLDSYGWALFRTGDVAGARRALTEAVALEPEWAEIHYHLGVVLAKQGLTEPARGEFARTLVLEPNHAGALEAQKALPAPTIKTTPSPSPTPTAAPTATPPSVATPVLSSSATESRPL
jgi:tetratricopeptide (TPR) repeat protein